MSLLLKYNLQQMMQNLLREKEISNIHLTQGWNFKTPCLYFSSTISTKWRKILLRNHQMVYACGIAESTRSTSKSASNIWPSREILSPLITSRNFPRLQNLMHDLLNAHSMFHLHNNYYYYIKMPTSLVSVKVKCLWTCNPVPCN